MFERIGVYPEANPTSLDPFHVYQPPQFQRHEVLPLHPWPSDPLNPSLLGMINYQKQTYYDLETYVTPSDPSRELLHHQPWTQHPHRQCPASDKKIYSVDAEHDFFFLTERLSIRMVCIWE